MLKDEYCYWCSRCDRGCTEWILPAGWELVERKKPKRRLDFTIWSTFSSELLCPDCAKKEREDARK